MLTVLHRHRVAPNAHAPMGLHPYTWARETSTSGGVGGHTVVGGDDELGLLAN
eukprot:CAMPEP_0114143426 /NCGR_PEP_ID=MMETSP0043_2-20121206/18981_1 /TAXON_ID=464988 /ORGANISM="Hemiselmis andersenii, Strain CCMP644" /LENGTH=52 /DNA_ID=CAMNT_0001237725 /DNA_START=89 /DNA_END=244 /DNA_ORIENTATION=+